MTLYEINAELERVFDSLIDPETGEIVGDTAVLDNLQMAMNEKIDNTACYIKNLLAEASVIYAQAKVLEDEAKNRRAIAKANENRAERLKKYLSDNLHGEKFKSTRTAISFRKSESVKVLDLSKIPETYLRYSAPEADKTALKKALKTGVKIEGAELIESNNIQIK